MAHQPIHAPASAIAAAFASAVLLAAAAAQGEAHMELTSSSIVGGQIQKPHACRGKGGTDQPLQLTVRGLPADARYVTIVGDDPDAVKPAGKVWVHWNVFNVPAKGELAIAAGQQPAGDVGQTTGGARGYEGMCPPDGVHTYRFAAFATRDKLPWTRTRRSPLTPSRPSTAARCSRRRR
jgi:Raf kinase inhibitor-like YbhB/YbcL family protein